THTITRALSVPRVARLTNQVCSMLSLGSRQSAATLHLREFLGRNAYPYTYVDLDTDKMSQELLDRFQVKLAEVPVVICCGGHSILRNPTIQELAERIGLNASIDNTEIR